MQGPSGWAGSADLSLQKGTFVLFDRGEAGKLHPGLWKIPPRLLENPTQVWVHPRFWKIPPRLLENPTQGSGKLQNLHEPCNYPFLDKQVSEEKLKK